MKIESDVTWERAEQVFPGCTGEWDEMLVHGIDGARGPTTERNVVIEIRWCGVNERDPILWVTEIDPERDIMHSQSWVRHPAGSWTAPMPLPETLLLSL